MLLARIAAAQTGTGVRADDLLATAKQAYTQDGPAAALPQFEKALAMYRSSDDQRSEAVTLGYIANCHRKLGNLRQALNVGQKALAMKERLGDRGEIGKTHNQMGLIYWDLAEYAAAIKEFEQAIEIGKSLGDAQLEGSAFNNLGLVSHERGDYPRALEEFRRALELHRSSHFERGESDALGNIGGVSLQLGRFEEGLGYYRQALALSRRLDLKPGESIDLGNIALCLSGLGEVDQALETFDQALAIAREAGMTKEEADWEKGKGGVLVGLGRYDAALEAYRKAQQAYERSGLKRELVETLDESGQVYELLGDTAAAERSFHRALESAQAIGNSAGIISSNIALGDLERRRKQYDAAEDYFSRALESARTAGDEGNLCEALINTAINDLNRNRLDLALENVIEAGRVAGGNGNKPAMAVASYVEAEIYRAQGRLELALDHYATAEKRQREQRDPELGWRILFGRGLTLEALGNNEDALKAYQASVEVIEQTRAAIAEERFRAGYIEDRFQVYVALVELLLKLGRPANAFSYSERLRARAYFDQLGRGAASEKDPSRNRRATELRSQLDSLRKQIEKEYSVAQPQRRGQALELFSRELEQAQSAYQELLDTAGPKSSEAHLGVLDPPENQRLIPAGTALVEYVVGKQSLSILTIKRDSVDGTIVPVTGESLASRTELLRDLIMQRNPEWTRPGKGLHALLLAPLEEAGYLRGVRRLVIIPDGTLNYVPFAALPTASSRVLGDDFVLAYLPAAAALAAGSNAGRGGRSLLAMAPSESHLPNAGAEIRSIGEMFPRNSLVIAGKGATKTLFKQVAGRYDYLHLATHGSLNRNAPWLSSLVLQPDEQNDGRLELHEILDLKLHARLVTLSACETALGSGYFTDTPAGDEFVGMTRAFLGAGSDSVLASLWAVNDESTRALMVRFYRHLRELGGPEALARAQREMRRTSARYNAPYYWAAFVLVGPAN
jgi:CHAT domain-containing protein/Tfp pilus assembly protein PilF